MGTGRAGSWHNSTMESHFENNYSASTEGIFADIYRIPYSFSYNGSGAIIYNVRNN